MHADQLRTDCEKHCPRAMELPEGEQQSRFTMLFERLAID
jgi:hypothetical protein